MLGIAVVLEEGYQTVASDSLGAIRCCMNPRIQGTTN